MAKNEINTAFDILLDEVEGMVNDLNQDGARALGSGDYEKATGLIEEATRLTEFRERLRELRQEWQTQFPARARPRMRRTRKATGRLPRGLRTSRRAFRTPILEALVQLGGSARVTEVLDLVAANMGETLNKYDRQFLTADPSQLRWRNTAQWCRLALVREGLLQADSPRGVWEISPEGRRALQARSQAGTAV